MSGDADPDAVERQRHFYDTREHAHLRAREADHYSRKLVHRLVEAVGIEPGDRVLEVGAGFGRFTFELLERCDSVVALDLSQRALDTLEDARDARGIDAARCQPWMADSSSLPSPPDDRLFDHVVGWFILHHLPDHAGAIGSLARLLAPGGGIGFVEPNRRNPLFLAQVACCADMTWAEEKGMFTLGYQSVEAAYSDAGLESVTTRRFGFFPPQIANRWAAMRALESRLERSALIDWVLPFLLCTARSRDHV